MIKILEDIGQKNYGDFYLRKSFQTRKNLNPTQQIFYLRKSFHREKF